MKLVTDASGAIGVSVPVEWDATKTKEGATVVAESEDPTHFLQPYHGAQLGSRVPGVFAFLDPSQAEHLSAGRETPDPYLSRMVPFSDYDGFCGSNGSDIYERAGLIGFQDRWTKCAGGNDVTVITAAPKQENFVLQMFVFTPSDSSSLGEHIVKSLTVDRDRIQDAG